MLVVVGLFPLGGCGQSEVDEAEAAVRSYCDGVIEAYRTSDPDAARPVITDREWRKLVVLIDLKKANRVVLESALEELEVAGVSRPSPSLMTVTATERWRYYDRPLELGKPEGTEFVVEMDLEYDFVRTDGVWRMDQARTSRHDYLEPEGFRPQRDDPLEETGGESS